MSAMIDDSVYKFIIYAVHFSSSMLMMADLSSLDLTPHRIKLRLSREEKKLFEDDDEQKLFCHSQNIHFNALFMRFLLRKQYNKMLYVTRIFFILRGDGNRLILFYYGSHNIFGRRKA